jgi:hypothetical protein
MQAGSVPALGQTIVVSQSRLYRIGESGTQAM